jgi:hypothetical protein
MMLAQVAPLNDVTPPLAPLALGIVAGASHPAGWAFVQYVTCELFGPPDRHTSHRLMRDQAMVAMDALECLREEGYLRREGAMPKAGNEAGANQVYILARPAIPLPLSDPNDLPLAHAFVLDAFEREEYLDAPKLIRILSGSTVITPARGQQAYLRVGDAILKELARRRLICRTSIGWYCRAR